MGYIMDLRKIVGHKPLIMASAGVIIINKNNPNQILLQKRKDNGLWDYPGGSLELEDSFESAAIREAFEESGLKVKNLKFFTIDCGEKTHYVYPNGDEVYIKEVVYTTDDYDGEMKIQEEEVTEQYFFDIDKIPSDLSPAVEDVIKKFAASRKRCSDEEIIIRKCRMEDIDSVMNLEKEWQYEDITYGFVPETKEYLESMTGDYFIVCEINGQVEGFIFGSVHKSENMAVMNDDDLYIEIENLYVSKEYRNSGVGSRMLKELLKQAELNGVHHSLLYSSTKDLKSVIKFYEKNGYHTWNTQMFK